MKTGIVHVYSPDNELGVIKVSKNERYVFERKEWLSDTPPAVGLFVQFEPAHPVATTIMAIRKNEESRNES
jgi:hypothetical protein